MIYHVILSQRDNIDIQKYLRTKEDNCIHCFIDKESEEQLKTRTEATSEIFTPNGYSRFITAQRNRLEEHGTHFLTKGEGQHYVFPRKSKLEQVSLSSYIAEIGMILPFSVILHTDYDCQLTALTKNELCNLSRPMLNWRTTSTPKALVLPRYIDKKPLPFLLAKLLRIIRAHTNIDANECYITSSQLAQHHGFSRAWIDKTLDSPFGTKWLIKRKLTGSKNIGFEWTEYGSKHWVSQYKNVRSKSLFLSERTPHPGFNETYAFDTHVALIKRLGDEYKKALTERCQIPEIKREAAISLAMLDAM